MTVPVAARGNDVIGVFTLFMILATVTVGLRTYCRAILVKTFGWSDWLAIGAWMTFMIYSSLAVAGPQYGSGQKTADIVMAGGTLQDISNALKLWWACYPLYAASTMLIKGSIAIMLLNITTKRILRIMIHATLAVSLLAGAIFFFYFIFQCSPPSFFWNRLTGAQGTCLNTEVTISVVYAYSAVTCLGDFIFAIIPWFILKELDMRTPQKLLVAGVISLGTIASIATIARFPYIGNLRNQANFLYDAIDIALWTCVETGLGITAACAATLRPLLRVWSGKYTRSQLLYSGSRSADIKGEIKMGKVERYDGRQLRGEEKGFDDSTAGLHMYARMTEE